MSDIERLIELERRKMQMEKHQRDVVSEALSLYNEIRDDVIKKAAGGERVITGYKHFASPPPKSGDNAYNRPFRVPGNKIYYRENVLFKFDIDEESISTRNIEDWNCFFQTFSPSIWSDLINVSFEARDVYGNRTILVDSSSISFGAIPSPIKSVYVKDMWKFHIDGWENYMYGNIIASYTYFRQ